jgi:hypothetical protein
MRAFDFERRRRTVENGGIVPSHIKRFVFQRDRGQCRICGVTYNLHYDHIIAWSKGGRGDDAANVQLLCMKHNLGKGASGRYAIAYQPYRWLSIGERIPPGMEKTPQQAWVDEAARRWAASNQPAAMEHRKMMAHRQLQEQVGPRMIRRQLPRHQVEVKRAEVPPEGFPRFRTAFRPIQPGQWVSSHQELHREIVAWIEDTLVPWVEANPAHDAYALREAASQCVRWMYCDCRKHMREHAYEVYAETCWDGRGFITEYTTVADFLRGDFQRLGELSEQKWLQRCAADDLAASSPGVRTPGAREIAGNKPAPAERDAVRPASKPGVHRDPQNRLEAWRKARSEALSLLPKDTPNRSTIAKQFATLRSYHPHADAHELLQAARSHVL